jgi:hypothetical protein
MADKKLADLTLASTLTATDLLYVQQGANSRKAPLSAVRNTYDVGWAYFNDAASDLEVNAQAITANTRTLLTIDGGTGSILDYVDGSGIEWTSNAHRNNNVGDSFTLRLTFQAKKATGTAAFILVEQDIGDGTPQIVAAQEVQMRQDTLGHPLTFNFIAYALNTYQANGAKFYITATSNISIWDKAVLIRKDYSAGA